METGTKWRIDFYLNRIRQNLPETFSAPSLDSVLAEYQSDAGLREEIESLSNAGAVSRFYVAVLVSAVDKAKSDQLLESLTNDQTRIRFQKSIGHGTIEFPLYLAVKDFINDENSQPENLLRAESLDNWKLSVSMEKEKSDDNISALPSYEDVFEAQTDREKMIRLNRKVESLKTGSVAEKFYAAAVLRYFNETEAREILEKLVDEPAEVAVLQGDIMMKLPASQLAAELLGRDASNEKSAETQNPLARFFKWLSD